MAGKPASLDFVDKNTNALRTFAEAILQRCFNLTAWGVISETASLVSIRLANEAGRNTNHVEQNEGPELTADRLVTVFS